jgi:HTH-type transcriptional regulator/antitoxin HipB
MINQMPQTQEEIGRLIQELRKQKGLTQATFAEKLGVSESTVASYEVGRNNFTVKTLKRISEALGGELKIDIIM